PPDRRRRLVRAVVLRRDAPDLVGNRLSQAARRILPGGLFQPRIASGTRPLCRRRCGKRRPGPAPGGPAGPIPRPSWHSTSGDPLGQRPERVGASATELRSLLKSFADSVLG